MPPAIVSGMDENIAKIILAVLVGMLVGAEREFRVGQCLNDPDVKEPHAS